MKATQIICISAVFLLLCLCVGTVSAEAHNITSQADWESYFIENGTDLDLMAGEYDFKNGVILPMGNVSYDVEIDEEVTLEHSNFQDSSPDYEEGKFMNAVEQKEAQEVTLETNGGIATGKLYVSKNELPPTAPTVEKAGYNFSGWYGESALTNMVFNNTGIVNKSVIGWTDENGKWIHDGASILYANFTAIEYNVSVVNNVSAYPSEIPVKSVEFNAPHNVEAVAFKFESPQGSPQNTSSYTVNLIYEPFTLRTTGTFDNKANVTFRIYDEDMGDYEKENIRLAQYKNGKWTFITPTVDTGAWIFIINNTSFPASIYFTAEIDIVSPFAIINYEKIVSPTQAPYHSSTSSHQYSTIILSEAQENSTAISTATPISTSVPIPTIKPISKESSIPATPLPLFGLLAGIGVALLKRK